MGKKFPSPCGGIGVLDMKGNASRLQQYAEFPSPCGGIGVLDSIVKIHSWAGGGAKSFHPLAGELGCWT